MPISSPSLLSSTNSLMFLSTLMMVTTAAARNSSSSSTNNRAHALKLTTTTSNRRLNNNTLVCANNNNNNNGEEEELMKSEKYSYVVHKIQGDGRCLFRSLVVSKSITDSDDGVRILTPQREIFEADNLREKTIEELMRRREELEWIIEGDFDEYCKQMRYFNAWGGEPEILVASHVLKRPIDVNLAPSRKGEFVRKIGVYGEEYSKNGKAVHLLFHGAGHYEALSISSS